ncbi:hypothetical protein BDB01DRAFT_855464 [Pilobolus umbonatus]|nr:hypothetical protein BDB01DRAFT_855464 [Pilobolus umbonatus]
MKLPWNIGYEWWLLFDVNYGMNQHYYCILRVELPLYTVAFYESQEHNDMDIPKKTTSASLVPESANVGLSAQALPSSFKVVASKVVSKPNGL